MFVDMLRESLNATMTRKIGSLLSREAYREFKKRLDYSEYGGAPLLGVKGVCAISHGRSNANAMKNAVRVAAEFSKRGINDSIERRLAALWSEVLALEPGTVTFVSVNSPRTPSAMA